MSRAARLLIARAIVLPRVCACSGEARPNTSSQCSLCSSGSAACVDVQSSLVETSIYSRTIVGGSI